MYPKAYLLEVKTHEKKTNFPQSVFTKPGKSRKPSFHLLPLSMGETPNYLVTGGSSGHIEASSGLLPLAGSGMTISCLCLIQHLLGVLEE